MSRQPSKGQGEAPTLRQLLLQAASELSEKFCEEDLVLAAWLLDKRRFGLGRYHIAHPDNNRVRATLVGHRGLIADGLLERIGPKQYRLTEAGRSYAVAGRQGRRLRSFRAEDESRLEQILSSLEFSLLSATNPPSAAELSAALACDKTSHAIEKSLAAVVMTCNRVLTILARGCEHLEFNSGRVMTAEQIEALKAKTMEVHRVTKPTIDRLALVESRTSKPMKV
jgi:hypothetical protein